MSFHEPALLLDKAIVLRLGFLAPRGWQGIIERCEDLGSVGRAAAGARSACLLMTCSEKRRGFSLNAHLSTFDFEVKPLSAARFFRHGFCSAVVSGLCVGKFTFGRLA